MMESSFTRHLGVIAAATVVALAVWAVLRVVGVDFTLKEDAPVGSVGLIDVAVTTVIAGIAAWIAHGVIVRLHWSRYWTLIGSGALALSLLGPSRMADGETAIALIALHLIVGWILIIGTVWACEAGSGAAPRLLGSLRRHPERG